MQRLVEGVEAGRYRTGLTKLFVLVDIADAYRDIEEDALAGKAVVHIG
jgi:hypothetical protein